MHLRFTVITMITTVHAAGMVRETGRQTNRTKNKCTANEKSYTYSVTCTGTVHAAGMVRETGRQVDGQRNRTKNKCTADEKSYIYTYSDVSKQTD